MNIDPLDPVIHTICHCFLGFVVDNSTADFPKTGTCNNLRTAECDDSSEVNCYSDEDLWGVCPYCRVRQYRSDGLKNGRLKKIVLTLTPIFWEPKGGPKSYLNVLGYDHIWPG